MSTTQQYDRLTAEVRDLKEAINLMDCFAQDGLNSIESIAELALLAMESPNRQQDVERYAQAFETILRLAIEARERIGSEAEKKECGHLDDGAERRRAARRAELQEGGAA